MKENYKKLSSSLLIYTFLSNVTQDIKYVSGENPFTINVNGINIYVYIKNLSPAYLSNKNPNVWRIQLPIKKEFEEIRRSEDMFILLGYDSVHKVYTSWNPYWCKQRLNIGKSVSMYSRLSLQLDVSQTQEIKYLNLNNDSSVVCIPSNKISDYIKNIKNYYPEETTFIPIGSKIQKRMQQTDILKKLEILKNVNSPEWMDTITKLSKSELCFYAFYNFPVSSFKEYLEDQGFSESNSKRYIQAISKLFKSGLINKYHYLFLKYDDIEDYKEAINELMSQPEVSELDQTSHGYFKGSLKQYVSMLLSHSQKGNKKDEDSTSSDVAADNEQIIKKDFPLNEFGQLTALDDTLKESLSSFIVNEEYPDYDQMINIALKYYPEEIRAKMSYSDWIKLFDNENWKMQKETTSKSAPKTRTKTIVVTRSDGSIIKNKFVVDTYIEVIKESYPDLIMEMGIYHSGVNIVSTEYDDKYRNYQKDIGNGFLVLVNSNTEAKYDDLCKINAELNLGLKIELKDIEKDIDTSSFDYTKKNGERYKIRVTFPNGKTIQYNKVLETLVEVVKYAGPEDVQKLGIQVCYDNLVLNAVSPKYYRACKPVGHGLFVNTASDTITKYNQICEISNKLHLNLVINLV